MADAPEIKVKLTAEDTGVSAAIKELGAQLKNLKKTQDDTAASGFKLASAFEAIAAAGALLGLAKIGRDAFDSAVNIGKLSDKTGISTQTLSVYNKVAEDVGASTEQLGKSLTKAAQSITNFQQGGTKAAGGFALLNISAKDFNGLNSDQKLQLVVNKLGAMQGSFQKTTAAQQIFGKGASDITLIANALAAQGMDKATAATAKLGLLLDQSTTDSFREAKASMQELTDVGKGMATQFEAGMLPAISDVGDALVDSLTQGGVNFKQLGQYAGDVIRGVALLFLGFGQTVGTVVESIYDAFSQLWTEIKNEAVTNFTAIGQAIHGHVGDALSTLVAGAKRSTDNLIETVQRQKAIYGTLADSFRADYANLFPSDEEEERRKKERLARLRPDKQEEAPEVKPLQTNDAAERAAFALLEKQLQDEIELRRAYAAQAAQLDKEQYDQGAITLAQYYDRRRAQVRAEAADEVTLLKQGLAAAEAEADKAGKASANAPTGSAEKDKQAAKELEALAKVDELKTKIAESEITTTTKVSALNAEQFKEQEKNQAAILEFEKQIDTSADKKLAAAKAEIAIEAQKLDIILKQQGLSEQQAQAEIARFTAAKTAQANFEQSQESGAAALKQLDDQKAAIEQRVASGQLFQLQGQEQIRELEQARIPALQKIADLLKEQAATGSEKDAAAAADFQKQVDSISVSASLASQQIATIKEGIQNSLVSGFTQFFETVGRGTQSVAQSFEQLAGSIIGSLAKMTAQMLAQIIVAKLLKAALGGAGGFSGGGIVPSSGGFPGLAEGGLIKGPGGPKADAIPARLSAGEYVVKADAVSAFGVHNLEAINRGLKPPTFANLALPKFAEGGLVGSVGAPGASGSVHLGIGLDKGLILQHLTSKDAGRIILDHITNNPKAASKALGRSQG